MINIGRAQRGRHGDVAQPPTPCCRAPRTTGPAASATSTTPGRRRSTRTRSCSRRCPATSPGRATGGSTPTCTGSGTGTMPRSAQQGAAAIHLYAPQFAAPGPGPLEAFAYLPYTHAYFPTERFDEVRQVGGWTLRPQGRRLRGAVVVAADVVAGPRPGGDVHERAHPAVRPGRPRRGRQRVDLRGRRRGHVGQLRRLRRRRDGGAGDRDAAPGRGRRPARRVRRRRTARPRRGPCRSGRPARSRSTAPRSPSTARTGSTTRSARPRPARRWSRSPRPAPPCGSTPPPASATPRSVAGADAGLVVSGCARGGRPGGSNGRDRQGVVVAAIGSGARGSKHR